MDIIAKIDSDIIAINKHWNDPENLSAIHLRLAISLEELGGLVSDAEFEYDKKEAEYKNKLDHSKIDYSKLTDEKHKPMAVALCESYARKDCFLDQMACIAAKHDYQVLKRKRENVGDILDSARTRISLIKQDIKRS